MAKTVRTARDPASLAGVVIGSTWAYLGATLLMAATCVIELGELIKLPPETVVEVDGESVISTTSTLLTFGGAIVLLATLFVSGFLILKWIYRVNLNAAVWAPGKTISPPWSVGWFFVPFANLLMPFRAMAETWRITYGPAPGLVVEAPDLLKWWWGLFLLTNILDNAGGRLTGNELAGARVLGNELSIASSLLAIPLCILLVRIVRQLSAAQSGRLATGDTGPPPLAEPGIVTA